MDFINGLHAPLAAMRGDGAFKLLHEHADAYVRQLSSSTPAASVFVKTGGKTGQCLHVRSMQPGALSAGFSRPREQARHTPRFACNLAF